MLDKWVRFIWLMTVVLVILLGVPGQVQASYATPQAACQAALEDYNTRHSTEFSIVLFGQSGSIAYATAARGEEHFVMLAWEGPQGWTALIPGESLAADYNQILDRFPEDLIDAQTRDLLRQPEPRLESDPDAGALTIANATAHKLPWAYGLDGYVTQKDTEYHMNQIDFDIQGLAASGDVIATKPGTVVFAKDSSNTTCQKPSPDPCWKKSNMVVIRHSSSEYSWYVHLAYGSITVSTGQNVSYGTKLGVEGDTGYSFGVHLHYMVSTSAPSTWPDPNDPDAAAWPTKESMTPVDFDEFSWAELVQTYSRTYRSQNASNLPLVCPGAAGVVLYRNNTYNCAGLLQNSGYVFRGSLGTQNVGVRFNDAASSIRIPNGWSVLLFEHSDQEGGQKCVNAPGLPMFSDQTFNNGTALDDQVSSFRVFSEPNCPVILPADLTAPLGSLTSPAAGAEVGRSVQLNAEASDMYSGVQAVRFSASWGGGPPRAVFTDTSAPYAYTWDFCAAGIPDGAVDLAVEIIDNAWNSYQPPAIQVTKTFDCASAAGGAATIACTSDQWCGEYWGSITLNGEPQVRRNEGETLAHEWASTSPDPLLPAGPFSSRFTRSAIFDCGLYRFTLPTVDGVRLWVDTTIRLDQWAEPAQPAAHQVEVNLLRGAHALKVEQFDSSGTASLGLSWQKISDCPAAAEVVSTSTHYVSPGAVLEPAIRVRAASGYLDPARGDHLAFAGSGAESPLGAGVTQLVRSLTDTGAAYTFAPANGLRMTAPSADGAYTSPWQVRSGSGAPLSANAVVRVIVDRQAPSITISAPAGNLSSSSVTIQANASDAAAGVSHVQFFALYRASSGGSLEWHDLGYDLSGADGWSMFWNASAVPDQTGMQFFAQAWDRSGNGNGTWTAANLILDRTPPAAVVSALAAVQNSTRFPVSWTASDNLSGVNRIDLQYQMDSGAWKTWLTGQTGSAGSAWFTGQLGHDYAFRARAIDQLGNTGSFSSASVTTHVNTCGGDSAEPDNDPSTAGNLTTGMQIQTHTLCGAGDQDWFRFQASAGKKYMFLTDGLGETSDTVLVLVGPDGSTVLRQDDPTRYRSAALTWQVGNASQTLYVMVRHTDSMVAGSAVTYNVQAFEVGSVFMPVILDP